MPSVDWDASTEEKLEAIRPFEQWIDELASIDGGEEFDDLRDSAIGTPKATVAWLKEMAEDGESSLYSPTGDETIAGMASLGVYCAEIGRK